MKIRTKIFLLIFLLTFSLSLLSSYLFYIDISKRKLEELRSNVKSIAILASLLVDEQKHSKLKTIEDMSSNEYIEIRDRLRQLKKAYPEIRYIYTMVKSEKPNIWKFVIDAMEPIDENKNGKLDDVENTTPLGEEYDVSEYSEMQKAFDGPIADKKLTIDKWGCWLSGYAPVYDSSGVAVAIVGVDISVKTIQQEKNNLKKGILPIFLLSVLISLVSSSILSDSITKPLLKVVETTKLISEGKYENFIQDKRKDEIGVLISSINEMSKNIKTTIDKLKTLSRTAEMLALTLDIDESLKLSMNLSLEILSADKGMILFLNDRGDKLTFGISSGFETVQITDDEIYINSNKFSLSIDSDFIDYIKKNPDVYTIFTIEKDSNLNQFIEWLDKTGTKLISPLIAKQDIRGFILLNAELKDKEFVKTFISQVAMSLENARLYHTAIVDGLTGLYVLRYFQIQLELEMKRAQRYGKTFSLLMMDIDHFKNFNDNYGHQIGDCILKETAKAIKLSTRATDIVARYGGDEIAIILPETDFENARVIAERIRKKVSEISLNCEGQDLKITLSIGIAEWNNRMVADTKTIIDLADSSLYKAKREGRDRICIDKPIT